MSVASTLIDNFSPLKIRNFRIYLGGQAISLIGTWLQVTALSWVVWELTHSELALGIVQMLSLLPLFLLAPWVGVWADRLDRRKLLIFTQVGMMLLAFILAALVLSESIRIWHIYTLSLLLGVFTALDLPTQQTFMGDLAGGGGEIRRAINLNVTIVQISRILGPAVAGIIVALLGAGMAFFINGLSFIAVIISLLLVRATQIMSKPKHGSTVLGGIREAVAFLRNEPRLLDCVAFASFATFFGIAIVLNVLPAFADHVLGGDAKTLGLLMSSSGAGALVGITVFAPLAQAQKRIGMMMAFAGIGAGSAFALLAMTNLLWVAMLGLFAAGLAMPTLLSTTMGLLQVSAPPMMRGRVISLYTMVSFGLQPLAALWIGAMAEWLGVRTAIEINAVSLVLVSVWMLSRTPLRQWDGLAGVLLTESQFAASSQPTPTDDPQPMVEGAR
ncbi:MAG: MFS transporter [Phototrophicaceae bacterium]